MAEDSGEVVREMAESVAATNLKVLADGPAFHINLANANAVSAQQGMNQIAMAITSKAAESIINTSPLEGLAAVGGGMQLVKAGGVTPPVTV